MDEYFQERKSSGGTVKVELDLSFYATEADLKTAADVNPSNIAKKVDFS